MTDRAGPAADELTDAECWALLSTAETGRLAVRVGNGVDIFPLNFLVKDETIFFSTAPGSKMVDLTSHPEVAFEADGIHDRRRWSVVVKGHARRLSTTAEIEESGIRELHTLAPLEKWNYVKVDPSEVSGRRFTSRRRARGDS